MKWGDFSTPPPKKNVIHPKNAVLPITIQKSKQKLLAVMSLLQIRLTLSYLKCNRNTQRKIKKRANRRRGMARHNLVEQISWTDVGPTMVANIGGEPRPACIPIMTRQVARLFANSGPTMFHVMPNKTPTCSQCSTLCTKAVANESPINPHCIPYIR